MTTRPHDEFDPVGSSNDLELELASKTRFVLTGHLAALAFILYLDRVCIAQAAPRIQEDLGLSNTRMGIIFMAFTLAYGLFEIPSGRMGDRIGSRRVLTRIVAWWSAFTIFTGACWGFWSLLVVRFLFGAGEAGAYPNAARVIRSWYPSRERGRVQGTLLTASLIGGALSPIVAGELIQLLGWRWTFLVFGVVGIVWAIWFYLWFRDDPSDHPRVNRAERKLIHDGLVPAAAVHEAIPWPLVKRHSTIWLLGGIVACMSFTSYFYFSWYPKYLQQARGVEQALSGRLAGMVLGGAAIGTLIGGWIADRFLSIARRSGDPRTLVRLRRRLGCVCLVMAAVVLVLGVLADQAWLSAALAALSCLIMFLPHSNWWTCAIDVSGKHVGSLFGLMNMLGIFGGIASQLFFGVFTDWLGGMGYTGRMQWDPGFGINATLFLVAAVCWLFVDASQSVDDLEAGKPNDLHDTLE